MYLQQLYKMSITARKKSHPKYHILQYSIYQTNHFTSGRTENDTIICMKKYTMSATQYVLLALVPYTRQNLLLTYSANRFFTELEQHSGYSAQVLKTSYKRAQKRGFIENDAKPVLTKMGVMQVQPFIAEKLSNDAVLMVIFDIPEHLAVKRRELRLVLRFCKFKQEQQSVWISTKDHKKFINQAVGEIGLKEYVQVYEAVRLT
jgi:hypothetical protein